MLKRIAILASATIFLLILLDLNNTAYTNVGGAPGNYAGGPKDGKCTSCHGGSSISTIANLISIDSLDSGRYVPNKKYTVKVNLTKITAKKFGFEVSPQITGGSTTVAGSIIVTNMAKTKIVSSKNITHKIADSTRTWSFDWIAPAKGKGSITFYGNFNAANGDGSDNGDKIYSSSLTVPEMATSGVETASTFTANFTVYPSIVSEERTINYHFAVSKTATINISLTDITGKTVQVLEAGTLDVGFHQQQVQLSGNIQSGIYFVHVTGVDAPMIQKIIVQ